MFKRITCAALLIAAGAMAQSDVTIHPIKAPDIDAGLPLAGYDAAAVSTPSAPDAWGGPRSGTEATLSDRVVRYEIDASLDPDKHTVTGQEKLTWRNRSKEPVRSVYLHLYLNAFESENSTFHTEERLAQTGFRSGVKTKAGEWGHIELKSIAQNGAKATWSFVHPDHGPSADHTVVRVDLPAPVAGGDSTTLDIGFFDQLPRVIARTGYFGSFHLVGQWFPKIGVLELPGERGATRPRWNVHEFHQNSEFYADFGSYDVRLTAPKDYTVGATGALQGTPQEKDGKLTHHYVQDDVHDFAWTADKRFGTPLTDKWKDVELRVLYTPEYKHGAERALSAAKASLQYFHDKLGPYPYKTLTVVVPPLNAAEAGGMEYPTFITADAISDVAEGTLGADIMDLVTIHEFGHEYFYGMLATNEFEEPMLDEGLNEFWQSRMMHEQKHPLHLSVAFTRALGVTPSFDMQAIERTRSPREEPADAPGANAWNRLGGLGPIYTRTATVMHDIEAHLGKETFEKCFKTYFQRWRFRHPSVADLRETFAEVSGQREYIEKTFAAQMVKAFKVDDRIDSLTSEEELPQAGSVEKNGQWTELNEEQVEKQIKDARKAWESQHGKDAKGSPFPYRTRVLVRRRGAPVPQDLVVRFDDGSSETVHWDGEENWKRFEWIKPARAVSAELDPERKHYLDVNKFDDSRTRKGDSRASTHWTTQAASLIQFILSLIAAV